ncbi:MAG: glycosyltransferase family 39 protein [Gammaproteobacteria bacterium]|nr:glycosyltransferase family 39 protein [Gammaproteobacteria bacterium]
MPRVSAPAGHDKRDSLLLAALALLMLGAGLGLRDAWPADEPRFAMVARDMVWSGDWLFPRRAGELYADKPPLFMWAIAGFYALTGSLRLATLLPSFLAGLGTLALAYDLARRLWDRRAALLAAGALLFTVQFTLQARTAQIDALLCFWTTLGLYGLCRHLLLGPAWGWFYAACVAMGLGIITKAVGFLPLLALIPYAYARARRWPALPTLGGNAWRWTLGPVLLLATVGAWLAPMLLAVAHSGDPALGAYRDNILFHQTVDRYANPWHHFKPFWYYLTNVIPAFWLPLVLLLPWLVPAWRDDLRRRDARVLLLLAYAAAVVLFFSLSPAKRGVYILPAVPALVLAGAPHLGGLLARPRVQRSAFFFALGLAALLALLVVYLQWVRPDKAARVADELKSDPVPVVAALALFGVAACALLRPARGVAAFCLLLFGAWQTYGWWAYPLLNPSRSGAGMMRAVERQMRPGEELAMLDFREQMVLQADRPVTHFGYHRVKSEEPADGAAWLRERPRRVVALSAAALRSGCFDKARLAPIGRWHGRPWYVARAEALANPPPDACARRTYPQSWSSLSGP